MFIKFLITPLLLLLLVPASARNQKISSFSSAKKKLEKMVYLDSAEQVTLYCKASFDMKKQITAPAAFVSPKYEKRAKRVEWEHVVPAENFGRNFKAWREGDATCINQKGQAFKGRRCAQKVDDRYRYMQADMYNLYPAIGSVNAARRNYNFAMLTNVDNSFGSCAVKIDNKKVQPPAESRGKIARSYLYMDSTYQEYQMSSHQRQLMQAWHKQYPVSKWECERAERIQAIQGNTNQVLAESCLQAGF